MILAPTWPCSQVNHSPACQNLKSRSVSSQRTHTRTHTHTFFLLFSLTKQFPISHVSLHGNSRAAEAKAFLRISNVKQKHKTSRGQRSKITSQSLVSPACFLLTMPLRSLVPALQCVRVCTCVRAHIGLNKPRDAGLVTQLSAIQPGLTLPLLLQAFQCPTTTHFPC